MDNTTPLFTAAQTRALVAARELARACDYEASHSSQVTRLALRLYDELEPLHHLGVTERFYLVCAGILHDIGWVEGGKNHHKTALGIILHSERLTLDSRERLIIGSVARYHFKALPNQKHEHFAALDPADQQVVLFLSAILRLADGLDRPHHLQVRDLHCELSETEILLIYTAPARAKAEEKAAKEKSNLLEQVFGRGLNIQWQQKEKGNL